MREILFRGKRVDNGEWVYGGYYKDYCYGNTLGEKTYITVWNTFGLGFIENVLVVPETVGQYTGLTDKNGQKIFEGDILQGDDGIEYDVLQGDDGIEYDVFHVARIGQSDENRYECFLDFNGDNECWIPFIRYFNRMEIIGNIHDNKELLQ